MEDLKSMPSMGESLQAYFSDKLVELLKQQTAMPLMTTRYTLDGEIAPPYEDSSDFCPHCGHCLEDPDY